MKFLRLTIGFLFVLCLTSNGMAQTITFKKRIYSKEGNVGWSVLETPYGYIMAGTGGEQTPQGYFYNLKLFKFDKNGNVLLNKEYGYFERSYYAGGQGSIIRTLDNEYMIAGSVQIAGIRRAMRAKFNDDLDTSWIDIKYEPVNSNFYDCRLLNNGEILVIGSNSPNVTSTDFYLTKYDSTGVDLLWEQNIGLNSLEELGHNIGVTPSGSLILVGDRYRSSLSDSRIGYIVKTDGSGDIVWDTTIGVLADNGPAYMSQLTDTSYLLFGSMDTVSNDYSPYFAKLDTSGRPQWLTLIVHDMVEDYFWQARELSDGNILLGGVMEVPGVTAQAVWLVKVSQDGLVLWERVHAYDETLPYIYQTWLRDFQETSDKGFIITGVADALDTSGLIRQKFLLMKLDSLGCLEGDCGLLTDVPETQQQPVELSVFPNPAQESFTIKYALPYGLHNNPQVVLYNLQGKQVYQSLLYKANDMLKVPTTDLGSGMYIYQLVSGGKVLGSGKVVVE